MDDIRICEVCGTHNVPDEVRCACGAMLAHIDLTPASRVVSPPVLPEAGSTPTGPRCSYDDCAMPNPQGYAECVYCGRPLAEPAPQPGTAATAATASSPEFKLDAFNLGASLPAGPRFRAASGGLLRLPGRLGENCLIIRPIEASGAEADLFLVQQQDNGREAVAKVYRPGMAPSTAVLSRLKGMAGRPVVEVYDHGQDEGRSWELLEYCPHGNLRQWLNQGPRARSEIVAMLRELSGALEALHAIGILHRDLKPENVLVRTRDPLALALTDFGTAAVQRGTQHFTDAARTTLYAAPETLAGIVDAATDWWALGMIVLEAGSGRHPFAGLSELVIAHRLATTPVRIDGIVDDRLVTVCAGLLMRDPRRRWKAAEVGRWLAGDHSLTRPEDTAGTQVRPYRIGTAECRSPAELAAALSAHWIDAVKDLARGEIVKWIDNEWHDQNLTRRIHDILVHRGKSDERKLLDCLVLLDERLPPAWRGRPLARDELLGAAARAASSEAEAQWLHSIFVDDVLLAWPTQHPDLTEIGARWRQSVETFHAYWKSVEPAVRKARAASRSIEGADVVRVVDFDAVVFGRGAEWAMPPLLAIIGPLLTAVLDPGVARALNERVALEQARLVGDCPWLVDMPNLDVDQLGAVLARKFTLPVAEAEAEKIRALRILARKEREKALEISEQKLLALVRKLRQALDEEDDDVARSTVDALLAETVKGSAVTDSLPVADRLRRLSSRFSRSLPAVLRALDAVDYRRDLYAIWFHPGRLALVVGIIFMLAAVFDGAAGIVTGLAASAWLFFVHVQMRQARQDLALQARRLGGDETSR